MLAHLLLWQVSRVGGDASIGCKDLTANQVDRSLQELSA